MSLQAELRQVKKCHVIYFLPESQAAGSGFPVLHLRAGAREEPRPHGRHVTVTRQALSRSLGGGGLSAELIHGVGGSPGTV